MTRTRTDETLLELGSELLAIFPGAALRSIGDKHVRPLFDRLSASSSKKLRAVWDPDEGQVVAFVFDGADDHPCTAVALIPPREPDEYDQQVAQGYARLFNQDLALAPEVHRHAELWMTLRAYRFPRAIARAPAFHTKIYRRALSTIDAASQLRYEGIGFNACIFMTKQERWVAEAPDVSFLPFGKRLNFETAMLNGLQRRSHGRRLPSQWWEKHPTAAVWFIRLVAGYALAIGIIGLLFGEG